MTRRFCMEVSVRPNLQRIDFSRQSIFGHSMGGHGAITLYLLNPSKYRSASGLAPILHPTNSPWGQKAFPVLLAGGVEEGKKWDATELLNSGHAKGRKIDIFVDYGEADDFLKKGNLRPESFSAVVKALGLNENDVRVRGQEGYDHSYYFVSTFAPEHIKYHAKFLNA